MFHNGQNVIADGRTATYVAYVNGVHYVATIAGIVSARTIAPLDLGAPRTCQLGAPLRRTSHLARVIPLPRRLAPLHLRAA
jgi:hypothetical protein